MTPMPDDSRPASQQVAEAIRAEILSGELARGAKLPSVRDLAKRHTVAVMTAQSAIEILRNDGLVYTSPGRGSFVREEFDETRGREHSPEYVAITEHLTALDAKVQQLTDRLAELEKTTKGRGSTPQ